MGFRKLRLFEITTEVGADGYPVYSATPTRLQGTSTDEDFNSVSIKLTSVKKSKTLVADDIEKVHEIEVGYDIELEVLGVDPAATESVFGFVKDTAGNVKEVVNGTKKKFGLFFEGKTASGTVFQKYLYKVSFSTPDIEQQADSGENVVTLKITGKGEIITDSTGTQVKAYTVYEGNSGFVTTDPTTMHKGPVS
jgi:hypothetical protein